MRLRYSSWTNNFSTDKFAVSSVRLNAVKSGILVGRTTLVKDNAAVRALSGAVYGYGIQPYTISTILGGEDEDESRLQERV